MGNPKMRSIVSILRGVSEKGFRDKALHEVFYQFVLKCSMSWIELVFGYLRDQVYFGHHIWTAVS